MIYAIYLALTVVAFLVVLNGFLKGAKKVQIDVALSFFLIGLALAAFVIAGWKLGLLTLSVVFLSAVITRPIAARTASRLLGQSKSGGGSYIGLPPRPLQRISQQLEPSADPNKLVKEMTDGSNRYANAKDALFDYCESQPAIQALMNEFQISREDLRGLYHQLIAAGAAQWACGHWVAASALVYPKSLRYLLVRRGENNKETAYKLIMYFEQGSALST